MSERRNLKNFVANDMKSATTWWWSTNFYFRTNARNQGFIGVSDSSESVKVTIASLSPELNAIVNLSSYKYMLLTNVLIKAFFDFTEFEQSLFNWCRKNETSTADTLAPFSFSASFADSVPVIFWSTFSSSEKNAFRNSGDSCTLTMSKSCCLSFSSYSRCCSKE